MDSELQFGDPGEEIEQLAAQQSAEEEVVSKLKSPDQPGKSRLSLSEEFRQTLTKIEEIGGPGIFSEQEFQDQLEEDFVVTSDIVVKRQSSKGGEKYDYAYELPDDAKGEIVQTVIEILENSYGDNVALASYLKKVGKSLTELLSPQIVANLAAPEVFSEQHEEVVAKFKKKLEMNATTRQTVWGLATSFLLSSGYESVVNHDSPTTTALIALVGGFTYTKYMRIYLEKRKARKVAEAVSKGNKSLEDLRQPEVRNQAKLWRI